MENKKGDYKYIEFDGIYRRVYTNACVTEPCANVNVIEHKRIEYDNVIGMKPLFSCNIRMCPYCKHKHCLEF